MRRTTPLSDVKLSSCNVRLTASANVHKQRSLHGMSSTSWSDGDQILAKSKDEKEKLEGFLNDIKNVAITFIPGRI